MVEMKHTPGPWDYDGPPHNIIVWSSPENRICFLTSDGPTEANARLISAAPDLLAALRSVLDDHTYETPSGNINCRFCDCNTDHEGTFRDTHDEDCLIHGVRAALSKAGA